MMDLETLGAMAGGLGLFLLGMGLMTDGLKLAAGPALHRILAGATRTRAHALGSGMLVTALVQSSSAVTVATIGFVNAGLLALGPALWVLFGANVGTTVTALLAAIGATPNARRAASAHVVFNLLTGAVALLLLPWIIDALGRARGALGLPPDPAAKLALFHTTFNLLGVLLMWPLAAWLTRWLQRRLRAREEDEAQPQFLDDNVLAVPTLALDALAREVGRAGQVAVRITRAALAGANAAAVKTDCAIHASLDAAIQRFVESLRSASMSQVASVRLAELLRIQRYHETAAEQALAAAALPALGLADARLAMVEAAFVTAADMLLQRCDPAAPVDAAGLDAHLRTMETRYEDLKAALLAAGAARLALTDMEQALRRCSALRRAVQQLHKSRRRLGDGREA